MAEYERKSPVGRFRIKSESTVFPKARYPSIPTLIPQNSAQIIQTTAIILKKLLGLTVSEYIFNSYEFASKRVMLAPQNMGNLE